MKLRLFTFILSVAFSVQAIAAPVNDSGLETGEEMYVQSITILASTSLVVPVTEISKKYSRIAGVDINTVYDANAELLRKVKDGDPADIIITPSTSFLEKLKEEGLVDAASVKVIAANRLGIVASKEMQFNKSNDVADVLSQIHNKTLMIIANPETTALGEITKTALENMGQWKKFEKRMVLAPTAAKTTDLIIKGQSAGIVFMSEMALYNDSLNNLMTIPDSVMPPMNYYAVVVVSGNMTRARKYLEYIASDKAAAVFKNNGFIAPVTSK